MTCLKAAPGGVLLSVAARPRSGKPGVGPIADGALTVRLSSPPADGAANEELARTISKTFGIPKTSVVLERGRSSRVKTLLLKGLLLGEAEAALAAALK